MSLSNKPWAMNRKEFLTDLEKVRTLVSIFAKFSNPMAEVGADEISVLGEWINIREGEEPNVYNPPLFTDHDIEGLKKLFSKLPQEDK